MKVQMMKIGDLREYGNNPRENDGAVDAVAKSIEEFGFKVPLVVTTDGEIICGHTRHKAAQKLGLAGIPCIVADDLTPRRRHKDGFHFATEISRAVAAELGLNFCADAISAVNRNRIEPEFHLEHVPDEACVILLDDVISTGETARECRRLLIEAGKVVFFVAAIRNN